MGITEAVTAGFRLGAEAFGWAARERDRRDEGNRAKAKAAALERYEQKQAEAMAAVDAAARPGGVRGDAAPANRAPSDRGR